MKGIYLAAYEANHPDYDLDYQDINGKRDIAGDMMDVDLQKYDFVIATPPCNYWSVCNYRRDSSKYALLTRHLLPDIISKLCSIGKPFLVENVRNSTLFKKYNLYDFPCFIYFIGRHTYWTNVLLSTDILQRQDFKSGGRVIKYSDMVNCHHQGGFNVHNVVEHFLSIVGIYYEK